MLFHLLAHTVKHTQASTVGRRLKAVVCEKCQMKFWYYLSRSGTGKGAYFILSSDGGAKERAMHAAQSNLAKRLERESELVPCPACHWVNHDLVVRARRCKFRRTPIWALFLLILGAIAFFFVQSIAEDNDRIRSDQPTILAEEVSAGFVIAAIALLPLRSLLRRRINPNRHFPQSPEVRPGTPPAIIVVDDTREGRGRFGFADVQYEPSAKFAGWAVLRSGQLLFPKKCCLCLNETAATYQLWLKVDTNTSRIPVPVPFCAECKRVFRRVWWMAALLIAAGAIGIGALALMMPGLDETGRWGIASIIAVPAAIALVVVPERLCRPYRFGCIDRPRGIMKFASKNAEYTQMMIEQASEMDQALARQVTLGSYDDPG